MTTAIPPRTSSTAGHGGTDFGDAAALAARIAAALEIPLEEAWARLEEEFKSSGTNVRRELKRLGIEPHVWSDALIRFYESTDAFFYELCAWNSTSEKRSQRAWIVEHLNARRQSLSILTYGDGLGFDGVELSRAGHRVTGYEVSHRCRSFAEQLAHDHRVSIQWLDREQDLEGRQFNVVVCLDVLEHVPDPPRLVQQLTDLLAPGGELIVHAPFWLLDHGTTTHLARNRMYSGDIAGLYGAAGLVPIDCRWMWNPLALVRQDEKPHRIPTRVVLSGYLLKLARFMPLPFSLTARRMLNKDLGRLLRDSRTPAMQATGVRP